MGKEKSTDLQFNPLEQANIFSTLTFWWLNEFVSKGHKRNLQETDMLKVRDDDSSAVVLRKLESNWKHEKVKSNADNYKPSLAKAIIKTHWFQFCSLTLLGAMDVTLEVLSPVCIGRLLDYFEGTESEIYAYVFASGIFVATLVRTFVNHNYYFRLQCISWHIQTGLYNLIYKKTLRLSLKALSQTSSGHIINLGSTDVHSFDVVVSFLNQLWLGPLLSGAITYLLWTELGSSSLAGLAVIFLTTLTLGIFGQQFGRVKCDQLDEATAQLSLHFIIVFIWFLRAKIAVLGDERIRLINEIISSMRVIKMYTWETPFIAQVDDIRRKELQKIILAFILKACNFALFILSQKLIVFTTFVIFVLRGGTLTPSLAFSAIALYNVIRINLGLLFPLAIEGLAVANVSLKRLQKFLLLDEVVLEVGAADNKFIPCEDCHIELRNVSISLKEMTKYSEPMLKEISFKADGKKLLIIAGPVGSGKTTLLNAILGELRPCSGTIDIRGEMAYAGQVPWLIPGTIKDNILFGEAFHSSRYEDILKVCDLNQDLAALELGDMTVVGSRGSSLSGGQKARISLARAAYRDKCGIMLLDNPLGALDPGVSTRLFDSCICGYMKQKLRILVTHQLQFLKEADHIIILQDGVITASGTYKSLQASGTDMASLMKKGHNMRDRLAELTDIDSASSVSSDPLQFRFDDVELAKDNTLSASESMSIASTAIGGISSLGDIPSIHTIPASQKTRSTKSDFLRSQPETISESLFEEQDSVLSHVEDNVSEHVIQPKDNVVENDEEQLSYGAIPYSVYSSYFGARLPSLVLLLILVVINHTLFVVGDWWLSVWSAGSELHFYNETNFSELPLALFRNSSNQTANATLSNSEEASSFDSLYYIVVYAIFTGSFAVSMYTRAIFQFYHCIKSGQILHDKMIIAVFHAPMQFFDCNPVGRILNRFSKDMALIDEMLPPTFMDFSFLSVSIITFLIVTIVINWLAVVAVFPLLIVFVWLRQYYIRTSRNVKRLEAACRTPIYTHISATLQGLSTIRSFRMESYFEQEFQRKKDLHGSAWFLFLATSRWFMLRLDIMCALFTGFIAFLSILTASYSKTDAGQVGLALTYSISLLGMFQWGTRQSTEVENQMSAVERVIQFTEIQPETSPGKQSFDPPDNWPQYGIISYDLLNYSHQKNGPLILKNILFNVKAQEKIGIVGRTGAGKTSLFFSLFRFNEFSGGEIFIDGVPISKISLNRLRKVISVIPQEAFLFSGTIRDNLDIFSTHTDEQIWRALEQVELKTLVKGYPSKLNTKLADAGLSISVGQRQLFCLARAILERNKIILVDEATASIDMRTDRIIQDTIRRHFQHCTVLTIAHRLNTIIDSDKILVLDGGEVAEFDEPHLLLQKHHGWFSSMVDASKFHEASSLRNLALKSYNQKHALATIAENPHHGPRSIYLTSSTTLKSLRKETTL